MLIYTSLFSECLLINSINSTVCGAGVKMYVYQKSVFGQKYHY